MEKHFIPQSAWDIVDKIILLIFALSSLVALFCWANIIFTSWNTKAFFLVCLPSTCASIGSLLLSTKGKLYVQGSKDKAVLFSKRAAVISTSSPIIRTNGEEVNTLKLREAGEIVLLENVVIPNCLLDRCLPGDEVRFFFLSPKPRAFSSNRYTTVFAVQGSDGRTEQYLDQSKRAITEAVLDSNKTDLETFRYERFKGTSSFGILALLGFGIVIYLGLALIAVLYLLGVWAIPAVGLLAVAGYFIGHGIRGTLFPRAETVTNFVRSFGNDCNVSSLPGQPEHCQ